MRTLLFTLILPCIIFAQSHYIEQIKVIDECTHLTEVLRVEKLGIKGVLMSNMQMVKSIKACEASLKKHPDDPHVQFLLARGYTKASRYEEGFTLAYKSCTSGDLGGCTLLGGYYEYGFHIKRDEKKAHLLWLWSCTQGDSQACINIAIRNEKLSLYIPNDTPPSSHYYLQACVQGNYPEACHLYARGLYSKEIPYDNDLAEYASYKTCISGQYYACLELLDAMKKNGDPHKNEKWFYVNNTLCDEANGEACRYLGDIYSKKPRNRENNFRALTLYNKACDNGDERFGCWYAGRFQLSMLEGIAFDIPKGLNDLEKACYIGMNSFACYDLARFYLYNNYKGYNIKSKARKPLERACTIGNRRAFDLGCEQHIEKCCEEQKISH